MKKIIETYYRWKAKRKNINHYLYLIENDKLLEEFETQKLLEGGSGKYLTDGRTNLLQTQMRLKEEQRFVDFLKSL